nr:PaaX family transcriptional regulator C-terminal domain-containing protein [Arthrobacter sp. SDTb3-6]
MIVTLYGLYGSLAAGSLPVAGLVALLADLGVDGPAARSSVSRLKHKGVLRSVREGRVARYELSDAVLDAFHADDQRIFAPVRSRPGDPWSLVVFSVPEAERNRRYELRSELVSLGFGTVSAGVCIAPGTALPQTVARLAERGLDGYVEYFDAAIPGGEDVRGKVARWWDLAELDAQYQEFLDGFGAEPRRWAGLLAAAGPGGLDPLQRADAFKTYVSILTVWRRFPYRDPNLPFEYLPDGWKAPLAKKAFLDVHGLIAGVARAHAQDLLGAFPSAREPSQVSTASQ